MQSTEKLKFTEKKEATFDPMIYSFDFNKKNKMFLLSSEMNSPKKNPHEISQNVFSGEKKEVSKRSILHIKKRYKFFDFKAKKFLEQKKGSKHS